MKTLLKFSSVHVQVYNHFNQERHLITRQVYKAETLDRIDGMARPRDIDRRLRAGVPRYASTNAVTLTTPR
jgi:alpha-N-acetylglucosamine transferase